MHLFPYFYPLGNIPGQLFFIHASSKVLFRFTQLFNYGNIFIKTKEISTDLIYRYTWSC
jgi:hypothetical protein